MAGINKSTRQQIRVYMEGFIEGILQEYRHWRSRERITPRKYLNARTIRIVADLFVKTHKGSELYFEMKSPMPNKGQCLEVTQRLLRIQRARGKGPPEVQTYFAMPYNPYGGERDNYQWGYARRYLPFEDGVLISEEFWNLLGGKGTYEQLLEIYYEVGQAKAKDLLELLGDAP
jgi:hypothetical protein